VPIRAQRATDLEHPVLSMLRCAVVELEPGLPLISQLEVGMGLNTLLHSRLFQAASGGTLRALRNLSGEALLWNLELAPYAALEEVSFDDGDSWISMQIGTLANSWPWRLRHVRIAARSISFWYDPSRLAPLPPLPPVSDAEQEWALPRFLAALEPVLHGSDIHSLELEARHMLVVLPVPAASETRVLLSRNVQQPNLGIELSMPARPALWTAMHGSLSATFTRPAPGNNDAVLLCAQRHV